jgi:putative membrane protein
VRRVQIFTAACAALMWTAAAGAQAPGAAGSAQGTTQAGSSTGATAAPTTDLRTQDERTSTDPTGTRSSNNDLQQFVEKATISNMAEIQLGQLALQQAQDPQVKQFAQMMVDEHTSALQQLRSVATSQGLQVASELDSKHQKQHEKLSKLQGAEFDRAYMDAMVDSHKDAEKLLKRRAGKDASASASNASGSQGASRAPSDPSGTSAVGTSGTSGSDTSAAGTSGSTSASPETGTPSVGTPGTTGTSGSTMSTAGSAGSAGSTMAPTSADEWASMTLPKVRAHLEQARTLEDQVKGAGRNNNNNTNDNPPAPNRGTDADPGSSSGSGGSTPPRP